MAWTGGQYSVLRALLAVAALVSLGDALLASSSSSIPLVARLVLLGLGGVASGMLALGRRDRPAAIGLAVALLGLAIAHSLPGGTAGGEADGLAAGRAMGGSSVAIGRALMLPLLLGLHALTPPAPYGAWDARGRVDPAGDWRMPTGIGHAAGIALALVHVLGWGATGRVLGAGPRPDTVTSLALVGVVLRGAVVVAALRPGLRPTAWTVIVLWQVAWSAAFGNGDSAGAGIGLLHLLAASPAWLPGRPSAFAAAAPVAAPARDASPAAPADRRARLFYDGSCGLCHRSVRFVLAEERGTPEPLRLRFAPLDGDAFEALLARTGAERAALPDSIVLELPDGRLLTRSRAAIEIASRLGGLWRGLAVIARPVPDALLDRLYDAVARVRKRIFAAPKDSCPILPPHLRARFD